MEEKPKNDNCVSDLTKLQCNAFGINKGSQNFYLTIMKPEELNWIQISSINNTLSRYLKNEIMQIIRDASPCHVGLLSLCKAVPRWEQC